MEYAEDLKNKILKEGFPLQRYCSWILQKKGWQVDEEYPVLWQSSYVDTQGMRKDIRTSGDIRAEFQYLTNNFAVRLCISCKKQSEIEWTFMRAMFTESSHKLLRLCAFPVDNQKIKNGWEYGYNFETKDWNENYRLCNIPTTLVNRTGKSKSHDEDKILQTADNLYVELKQTVKDDTLLFSKVEIPYNQIIYMPVIVTGATIYSYDINQEKFTVDNPSCINIENVSYLLYQHRLPVDMQVWIGNPHVSELEIFDKFNIFVVHYKEFERFITVMQNYFSKKEIPFPLI